MPRKPRIVSGKRHRWLRKSYDFGVGLVKGVGVASVIYGVVFGIFQYYESKKEKRIEESLALFRQFNNAPFTDYRKHLNIALVENRERLDEAASDEKLLTDTIIDVVQTDKLETDLAFVLNFFDTVVYCAARNICDPDIILDLFYPSARELYVPFYQYIQARQNPFNDFGAGVLTLVSLKQAAVAKQAALAKKTAAATAVDAVK